MRLKRRMCGKWLLDKVLSAILRDRMGIDDIRTVLLLLLLKSVEIDDNVALLRVVEAVSSVDPKMTP